MDNEEKSDKINTSPSKAIRMKCLECANNSRKDVSVCSITTCPLFAFRFGKNPYSKRGKNIPKEVIEARREQMKKNRVKKGNV